VRIDCRPNEMSSRARGSPCGTMAGWYAEDADGVPFRFDPETGAALAYDTGVTAGLEQVLREWLEIFERDGIFSAEEAKSYRERLNGGQPTFPRRRSLSELAVGS
jgi:hypothetical protein